MNREFFILSWVFWLLMAAAIAVSYGEAPIWVNFIGAVLALMELVVVKPKSCTRVTGWTALTI